MKQFNPQPLYPHLINLKDKCPEFDIHFDGAPADSNTISVNQIDLFDTSTHELAIVISVEDNGMLKFNGLEKEVGSLRFLDVFKAIVNMIKAHGNQEQIMALRGLRDL